MGLVPEMTEKGDYIAVFDRKRMPCVLRMKTPSMDSQHPYCSLLGDCYIHGRMHSQAWTLIEEFKCKLSGILLGQYDAVSGTGLKRRLKKKIEKFNGGR
jgi:hypothetical protein